MYKKWVVMFCIPGCVRRRRALGMDGNCKCGE